MLLQAGINVKEGLKGKHHTIKHSTSIFRKTAVINLL